jgi:hypothetical protein
MIATRDNISLDVWTIRSCLEALMTIHDLPGKWRDRARGDAAMLTCANELEAHLKGAVLCHISTGKEIHFELVVPEGIFRATINKTSFCTLSSRRGDTRRATLVFA